MRSLPASLQSQSMLLLLAASLMPVVHSEQSASGGMDVLDGYVVSPFSLPIDVETVHLVDLNADARQDLILELRNELRIVRQGARGFDLSNKQSIPIPQEFAMWDVARTGKDDTGLSIIVLDSDSNLTIWQLDDGSYRQEMVVVPVPSVHMPRDTSRSRFCIDVNGDSIDDLALPTTHFLYVLELSASHEVTNTSKIPLLSKSSASLSAEDLSGGVGQSYNASSSVFRDLDNDSYVDLVLQNDGAVRISLGNASESGYFAAVPDYDISYVKDSRKFDFDSIDFSNLFSLIRLAPNRVHIKDINQDQLFDLTILEPNRVLTYIAGDSGIDTSKPTQVMRFNENTLILDILDVADDGMLELVAVKTPYDIAISRALLALVLPTSLRFELLVFQHSKGLFSRSPFRRLLAYVKVPNL